ncbi:MAG: hypothetical protein JJV89_03465 [Desulfosarcina sp.]|nr:hypothetical protein [Desulfobacterales bacterium]
MNLSKLTQGRFSAWPENFTTHIGVLTDGRFTCFAVAASLVHDVAGKPPGRRLQHKRMVPQPVRFVDSEEDLIEFIQIIVCSGILE